MSIIKNQIIHWRQIIHKRSPLKKKPNATEMF